MMFYERGDKSKKKQRKKVDRCNMRTVTTEDNPYKVAGDILFCVFGSGIGFQKC